MNRAGRYLFLEIDRQEAAGEHDKDEEMKEILLYPLQLKKVAAKKILPRESDRSFSFSLLSQSYSLFGFRYSLLGTIHYHLEAEGGGGGHYVTNLFGRCRGGSDGDLGGDGGLTCVRAHETEIGRPAPARRNRPDFDSDAFVVALQRVGESDSKTKVMAVFFCLPSSLPHPPRRKALLILGLPFGGN